MTSRPGKPTPRARTWDDRERRSMLLNIGFGLTIVAAILLLLVAWGVSWYSDHLAAAGTVNGTTITRDAFTKQVEINAFRAEYQLRRISTLVAAGHIGVTDAEARRAVIEQRTQQIGALSLEQLIDGTLQASLAAEKGVAVTPAEIDARFAEEATTPELRHAWVIEVKPATDAGATVPTDAQIAAANAIADKALADLRAGKDWESIAKAVSTAASKEQAGDLGFIDENTSIDATIRAELLKVAKDAPTPVVVGADQIFRIGRVTEIVAPVVDATLAVQLGEAGISMDDFRAALGRDATRTKLSDAIVAPYLVAGPQREVSQILLSESPNETAPGAVRIRHILYSPGEDVSASPPPDTDPSWATAKANADAAYARIKADPSLFDSIARTESDDGSSSNGGKLGYWADDGSLVKEFADAVFKDGLQPGQLLEPVKTEFGWHVIQILSYPTDAEWLATLKSRIDARTLTFADAARDHSEGDEAVDGGSLGWIAKGQIEEEREAAIFAAPIGKVSDPLVVDGTGSYLFLVSREETRTPDAEQEATIRSRVFSSWYQERKGAATITRDDQISGGV